MTGDSDIDRLIRAAWTVAGAPLAELRSAATRARATADRVRIDPSDPEHLAADLSAITSLAAAAEMLDLIVTYRTVQLWGTDDPIDLNNPDHTNGEQHR